MLTLLRTANTYASKPRSLIKQWTYRSLNSRCKRVRWKVSQQKVKLSKTLFSKPQSRCRIFRPSLYTSKSTESYRYSWGRSTSSKASFAGLSNTKKAHASQRPITKEAIRCTFEVRHSKKEKFWPRLQIFSSHSYTSINWRSKIWSS